MAAASSRFFNSDGKFLQEFYRDHGRDVSFASGNVFALNVRPDRENGRSRLCDREIFESRARTMITMKRVVSRRLEQFRRGYCGQANLDEMHRDPLVWNFLEFKPKTGHNSSSTLCRELPWLLVKAAYIESGENWIFEWFPRSSHSRISSASDFRITAYRPYHRGFPYNTWTH